MPACHAGERGSIPRRGGIKLPPHPKLGWSPLFAFSPSPVGGLSFFFTLFSKTIPRLFSRQYHDQMLDRRVVQQSAEVLRALLSRYPCFCRWGDSYLIVHRQGWHPPDRLQFFKKTNKVQVKIFQMKMNDFFFMFFISIFTCIKLTQETRDYDQIPESEHRPVVLLLLYFHTQFSRDRWRRIKLLSTTTLYFPSDLGSDYPREWSKVLL